MIKEEFKCTNFGFSNCDSCAFYTPQFPLRWKYLFLCYRSFVLIYMITWLIPHAIHKDVQGTFHWHLTNWAEVFLTFYFLIALLSLVINHCKTTELDCNNSSDQLSLYCKFHWLLFNVAADLTILVVLLFWSLAARLLPTSVLVKPIIIHLHGVNLLLLLIDILIISVPVRVLHFVYGLTTAAVYILFTLILHWSGVKSDIYQEVLDWQKYPSRSALFSFFGAFVLLVSHLIVFLFYKLRIFLFRKFFLSQRCKDSSATNNITSENSKLNKGLNLEVIPPDSIDLMAESHRDSAEPNIQSTPQS